MKEIIKAPIITEKSANISVDGKKVVLKVSKDANKVQITPEITVTLYPNYLRKDINYLVDCVMKDTFNTNNLKLGEGIHHSQIVKELMQIEGVRYVECKIPNYPDEIKSTDIVMLDGYILNNIGGI